MPQDISRRTALLKGATVLSVLAAAGQPSSLFAAESYADPVAAELWLNALLSAPASVAGMLHMGRFRDRTYFLDQPINWKPGPGQQGPNVTVPKGFVTDLASIPRAFWSLLPPDGAYTYPAIIHDYLYWTQAHSREIADSVFRYSMQDMKVSTITVASIYEAVRLGGEGAWNENAALKKSGEKRLMVKFPTDPLTTWPEWKKTAGCCADL